MREGRDKIRKQHERGATGPQVCAQVTDLFDGIVLDVWNAACAELVNAEEQSGIALIAHGGFGRRDLAPYSDVDLMLLHNRNSSTFIQPLASRLSRDIVDCGLQLGFATRSMREACRLSWQDPVIFSSLTESRLLAGSYHIYSRYFNSLRQGAHRRVRPLLAALYEARREEASQVGRNQLLLRPNVKRSRGGLRDIHSFAG